jgi:hypothetical protein
MGFFNSLSIRIPLAIIGGILYGALTYTIAIFLDLPSKFAFSAAIIVFLFYLGSRLLILFSGIDSPYYSRGRKEDSRSPFENTAFYLTTQWVGKFYHYHDWALFVFLVALSLIFLASLLIDWRGSKPMGDTIQHLLNAFIPLAG